MYVQLSSSLSGMTLLVAAGVCYYAGSYARRSSRLANAKGVPLGILLTVLLVMEGMHSSSLELVEFLGGDAMPLT
ncbi:MAG: hypothetical protein WBD20_05095 [Pirellulaceae bacterium]